MPLSKDAVVTFLNVLGNNQHKAPYIKGMEKLFKDYLVQISSGKLTIAKMPLLSNLDSLYKLLDATDPARTIIDELRADIRKNNIELKAVILKEMEEESFEPSTIYTFFDMVDTDPKRIHPMDSEQKLPEKFTTGISIKEKNAITKAPIALIDPVKNINKLIRDGREKVKQKDTVNAIRHFELAFGELIKNRNEVTQYSRRMAEVQYLLAKAYTNNKEYAKAFNFFAYALLLIDSEKNNSNLHILKKAVLNTLEKLIKFIDNKKIALTLENNESLALKIYLNSESSTTSLPAQLSNASILFAALCHQLNLLLDDADSSFEDRQTTINYCINLLVLCHQKQIDTLTILNYLIMLQENINKFNMHLVTYSDINIKSYLNLLNTLCKNPQSTHEILKLLSYKDEMGMTLGSQIITAVMPDACSAYLQLLDEIQKKGYKNEIFDHLKMEVDSEKKLLGNLIFEQNDENAEKKFLALLISLCNGPNAVPIQDMIDFLKGLQAKQDSPLPSAFNELLNKLEAPINRAQSAARQASTPPLHNDSMSNLLDKHGLLQTPDMILSTPLTNPLSPSSESLNAPPQPATPPLNKNAK